MRSCGVPPLDVWRIARVTGLAAAVALQPSFQPLLAQDKPTGAPLVLSSIETEQEVPLAYLAPDGKTAKCALIRLHWNSAPDVGPNDDAASFTLDLPSDNPAAPLFTAQLWNASLASALAWQEPWEGARWKVLQTPITDGTGIDAALAVGMIATSARRPYPAKTVVIGHLNPDGSLGPVSHMLERLDAAADAGMTRVIIPSVQRFDTDASGQVINMVRHASDLHLDCVPVDDLVAATETTMNDPLPDTAVLDSSVPKYSNEVATYIDDFAHREQSEAAAGLKFAPKEADLGTYPTRLGAIWKGIYADYEAGQEAYRAGQVYVAYQLFVRANGRMNGANALAGQTRTTFDVKAALAESQDLHDHLQNLMNPPAIDQSSLESAVLVAEMADWAFDINAQLEGSSLVTKQTFSQRSDATEAEKDRAREAILFANEQCKYLLTQSDFYSGLLNHLAKDNLSTVDENAAHLLPQLIPAQLATARSFTEGIRATDLRDALLFDPRLVAYVNVLRQVKSDWDTHQRKKQNADEDAAHAAPAQTTDSAPASTNAAPVKLNSNSSETDVGFNPGTTYLPPHTVVAATASKKISDAAQCLIWVNHDCEIATLDEKYLRLGGAVDPATREWHVKDHSKIDAMLQMADIGARHGIAFAVKAEIDPSVLAMIYERAAHERIANDDATALDSLRNYWRCALLGNVCWQLAHTPKAQPVDLSKESLAPGDKSDKSDKGDKGDKGGKNSEARASDGSKKSNGASGPTMSTNAVVKVTAPGEAMPAEIIAPVPSASTNTDMVVIPPVAPIATNAVVDPAPAPVPDYGTAPVPAPAPAPTPAPAPMAPTAPVAPVPPVVPVAPVAPVVDESNVPVAKIATNFTDQPAPPAPVEQQPPPAPTPTPAPAPMPTPAPATVNVPDDANIPVAPIAKVQDFNTTTNAPPVPKPDAGSFP
jgi:hypothetical protein